MMFESTKLAGIYIVTLNKKEDSRGFFARSWCREEFSNRGLSGEIMQCNISYNYHKGTLRGLHYQSEPYEEAKYVRCVKGRIFDVVVDIRRESATYLNWLAIELDEKIYNSIYISPGFAHGFQTLAENTEVHYQMSQFFVPNSGKGLRWNDPKLSIEWPIKDPILSERDKSHPLL